MAKKYPQYVEPINLTENIGDSLVKINNNFWNIKEGLCEIKKRIEDSIEVRTFFYYGPNSSADSTSGMQDNITSRPSNSTIENFVNQAEQLNVPAISKRNDVVYIIYQKTGYLTQQATRITSGTVPVLGTSPGSAVTTSTNEPIFNPPLIKDGAWSTTSPDRFNVYSPAFIIWRLTFNGIVYRTDNTFPKFSQAETLSTPNWNNPRAWTNY
jgi:hypothetical protein